MSLPFKMYQQFLEFKNKHPSLTSPFTSKVVLFCWINLKTIVATSLGTVHQAVSSTTLPEILELVRGSFLSNWLQTKRGNLLHSSIPCPTCCDSLYLQLQKLLYALSLFLVQNDGKYPHQEKQLNIASRNVLII